MTRLRWCGLARRICCPATATLILSLPLAIVAACAAHERHLAHAGPSTAPASAQREKPFFNAREHRAEYAGPGQEDPPPEDIQEVKIGWFGPADPDHPTAGQMWCAATLAIEEANEAGGCKGLPFRLVTSWSENPWGTGVRGVIRLVYEQRVWAVAGGPDGASVHLAEQIVAKAQVLLIDAVNTDKTTNLANVPWIFSCAPSDDQLAVPLANALRTEIGDRPFAVITDTRHDSRQFATELLAVLSRRGSFPSLHVKFSAGRTRFEAHLLRLTAVRPAAVVLSAAPEDAARFLSAMHNAGLELPVFGDARLGQRVFMENAGQYAEGVVFPVLWRPEDTEAAAFAHRYRQRFGHDPDYTAAHTYDALTLLLAAVREAGLDRTRIRDVVRDRSPWHGVTGPIRWDATGRNVRTPPLGMIRDGRVVLFDAAPK